MPTIAVDIRSIHDTGVARYGRSLLAAAAPMAQQAGLDLLAIVRPGQEQAAESIRVHGHKVQVVEGDTGFIRDNPRLRDLLEQAGVDLYWTSHYTVDRHLRVPFSFTIHDLTRWQMPHLSYTDATFRSRFGSNEADRLRAELAELAEFDPAEPGQSLFTRYFIALNRCLAARAQRVTTVSAATAEDIRALLGQGRLDLVPCAVDTTVFQPRSNEEVDGIRRRLGLTGPYLVFVGLTHPNKRFDWLTAQLVSARHLLPAGTRLVAVGGYADQVTAVASLLRDMHAGDFVSFTGRLPDDELAALYTGASAWVTASVAEGSSLPALEALSCGSEVIATRIAALREAVGRHAHYYAPDEPDALVKATVDVLAEAVPGRGGGFRAPSWDDSARKLIRSWQLSLARLPTRV